MLFSATDFSENSSSYNINLRVVNTLKKGKDPLSFVFTFDGEENTEHHIRFFEKEMKPGMIEFPSAFTDHLGHKMIHIMFYSTAHHTSGITGGFGISPLQTFYEKGSFSFYIERGHDLGDPYLQRLFEKVYSKGGKPKDALDYIKLKLITNI